MNKQDPGIQYLDYTWNPIKMRCTPVDEGCKNCWHLAMIKLYEGDKYKYAEEGKPELNEKELQAPLKLKKPSVIGVQFMGGLFHEDVPNRMIDSVFTVMTQLAPQHTYLVLTKRIERIAKIHKDKMGWQPSWKNIHLGFSFHDQASFDKRAPLALSIPAAKHWGSYEPALGEVDFEKGFLREIDPVHGEVWEPYIDHLNYIIAGHESGKGARKGDILDLTNIDEQCKMAGVPCFIKQWWAGGKLHKAPRPDRPVWEINNNTQSISEE